MQALLLRAPLGEQGICLFMIYRAGNNLHQIVAWEADKAGRAEGTSRNAVGAGVGMNHSLRQLQPDEANEPDELQHLGSLGSMDDLRRMNDRFVTAMIAAIRAGNERPPRVGIDQTPGTKKPLYHSTGR